MKKIKKTDINIDINTEELQKKCNEYLTGWKRAQADYQNLEKETAKRKTELVKMANADLLMEILPIFDNLKLAIKHIPKDQKQLDWVIGIEHIKNQFKTFLENSNITEIKTIGEKFDPELHEAVQNNDQTNKSEETNKKQTITEEIKSGYELNNTVLYPAKVIVG